MYNFSFYIFVTKSKKNVAIFTGRESKILTEQVHHLVACLPLLKDISSKSQYGSLNMNIPSFFFLLFCMQSSQTGTLSSNEEENQDLQELVHVR